MKTRRYKTLLPLLWLPMMAGAADMPPSPERQTVAEEHALFRHVQLTLIDVQKRCFRGAGMMLSTEAACQRDAMHVKTILGLFVDVKYSDRNALPGLLLSWRNVIGPKLVANDILIDATLSPYPGSRR